jgi:hypothetical protein
LNRGRPRRGSLAVRLGAAAALALATATLPSAQPAAPSPASVLGFELCADYTLATYEQAVTYFEALAAARPDRVRLESIGLSTEGRRQIMAVVSSEENLRQIDTYKTISRRLALARDGGAVLSDAAARDLSARGKVVVWIDFGLHASEVATAQAAPDLALAVATDESAEMRAVRDNVILLLVPNLNPDGTTMVAEWYARHRGRAWESRLPELWHSYVGHDINRDGFMLTQRETINASRQLYREWFPQIVYNHHQAGPHPSRIFVPPFDEPLNPNIPPLVIRGVNEIGSAITRRLEQEGKTGAVSRVGFDAWWNGGMRTVPYFHNMMGILTETAHPSATPTVENPASFPTAFPNGVSTSQPSSFYPSPYRGGPWHLRDSCDYIRSASLAVLELAARRRQEWLFDIFRMGRDAIAAHAGETFIIPADQWDAGAADSMIAALQGAGIKIRRAAGAFRAGDRDYRGGAYLIPGAQPFRPYIHDLLTPQIYPEIRAVPGGPLKRPYDITGWTLSYQMGVEVHPLTVPVVAETEPVADPLVRSSALPPKAGVYAIDTRANDAFTAVNRLLAGGETVLRVPSPVTIGGSRWPHGSFAVTARPGTEARVAQALQGLRVTVATLPAVPVDARQVVRPRIGLYHAWGGNIDEGWTRWLLEQFEFDYQRLHDDRVRAGTLAADFDVIVLPDATYLEMRDGIPSGLLPAELTGGMTAAGVDHLREFVVGGGTLVTMDSAAELPLRAFNLPVRDVTATLPPSSFDIPGSLLRLRVDPAHPLSFGMPSTVAAFFADSPAFEVAAVTRPPRAAASYPDANLRLSGWVHGETTIAGRSAVLEVRLGRGRVVLLGFRTQHRGQSHGTFKFLFNSLLLSGLGP